MCRSGVSLNTKAQVMLTSAAGSSAECWQHLFPWCLFCYRPKSHFSSQWGVAWYRLPHGKGFGGGCSKHAMTFTGRSRRWSFSLAIWTLKITRRAIRTSRSPLDQPHCPWDVLGPSVDPLASRWSHLGLILAAKLEDKEFGRKSWRRRNSAGEGGGLAVQEERQVGEGEESKRGCRFRQIWAAGSTKLTARGWEMQNWFEARSTQKVGSWWGQN